MKRRESAMNAAKWLLIISFLLGVTQGCLVVEKVSYSIEMKSKTNGTATIVFYDIRSDAIGNNEFEDDKDLLFNNLLKSDDFAASMKQEGKTIKSRALEIRDEKLTATGVYDFADVERIEGIRFQDGYYFLTLQTEEEVLSTNGEIMTNPDYKRIIWKEGTRVLKFEIKSGQIIQDTRDLVPVFRELQKK
jgi:hypothetical protein